MIRVNILKEVLSKPLFEQALYSAQSFLILVVGSKLFENELFGLFNQLILLSIMFSGILVSVTFTPMIQVRKNLNKNELIHYDAFNFIISITFSICVVIGIICYLLFSECDRTLIVVSALYLGLKVCYEFIRRFIMIRGQMTLTSLIALVNILFIFLSYVFRNQLSISLIMFLFFLSLNYFWIIAFEVHKVYSHGSFFVGNLKDKNILREHVIESRWLFLSSIFQIFSANYYLLALSSIHGSFQLAVFRSIQNITNLFNPLIAYYDNNIYIKVAQRRSTDAWRYIIKSMFKFLLLVFPFLVLINFFSQEILLHLYNERIAKYHTLVPIFTVSLVVVIITTFFRIYLKNRSINSSSFWSYILITIVAILSSSFLVGEYGIVGSAMGVLGTQIFFLLFISLHYIYVCKSYHLEKPRNESSSNSIRKSKSE